MPFWALVLRGLGLGRGSSLDLMRSLCLFLILWPSLVRSYLGPKAAIV